MFVIEPTFRTISACGGEKRDEIRAEIHTRNLLKARVLLNFSVFLCEFYLIRVLLRIFEYFLESSMVDERLEDKLIIHTFIVQSLLSYRSSTKANSLLYLAVIYATNAHIHLQRRSAPKKVPSLAEARICQWPRNDLGLLYRLAPLACQHVQQQQRSHV